MQTVPFTIVFSPIRDGCIDVTLGSSAPALTLAARADDCPFEALLDWLEALLTARLPATWYVREARRTVAVTVAAESPSTVHLTVRDGSANPLYSAARVDRHALVHQFFTQFAGYLLVDFNPDQWSVDLRDLDFAPIIRGLGLPGAADCPPFDVLLAERVLRTHVVGALAGHDLTPFGATDAEPTCHCRACGGHAVITARGLVRGDLADACPAPPEPPG